MSDRILVQVDEDLEAIMDRYLEIRQKELVELEEAVEQKNFEIIRLLGHRLKGTGSSYGLDELTRLGTLIEDKAMVEDMSDVPDYTAEIRHFLTNLDIEYIEVDE
ncbi:Hpt domain-containing protein [Maridesulfovibrio salexigens]|uniref:Hpt domain protein n=1 Tax=Maridesulfovibrio salexigens (strain ATCC 14822 / DSM 2638 / NCIMB 8403 / VKM B-1763) TaxID=526222 RepID=C6BSL2_MARSD|nr:Hpt domain-containing protein [Maridesulfovibrio salexigens]ACS81468.1 Hpt domain protein [Maridesulfovibrio salexigens DSM 2638]